MAFEGRVTLAAGNVTPAAARQAGMRVPASGRLLPVLKRSKPPKRSIMLDYLLFSPGFDLAASLSCPPMLPL